MGDMEELYYESPEEFLWLSEEGSALYNALKQKPNSFDSTTSLL